MRPDFGNWPIQNLEEKEAWDGYQNWGPGSLGLALGWQEDC